MTIPNADGPFGGGSCLPFSPEKEKRIVEELDALATANKKEGDIYYIVSARWWRDWQNYVGSDSFTEPYSVLQNEALSNTSCRPGEIDNNDLIENDIEEVGNQFSIKKDLMEEQDYIVVPEEVWKRLNEWYKGGPSLPRKLISIPSMHGKYWIVEVYPVSLKLVDARDKSRRTIRISRKESISELFTMVCLQLKLEKFKIRLWSKFEKKEEILLESDSRTIEEALVIDQEVVFEVLSDGHATSGPRADSTGNSFALVPLDPERSSFTIAGGPTLSNGSLENRGPNVSREDGLCSATKSIDNNNFSYSNGMSTDGKGLTGLHNLGNTCFMNSAIQCLVHTDPLVQYFLDDYTKEINEDNPLGMQGELAVSFGDLLRKLWSSGRTPVAPRAFKSKLSLFAPQFSGYNQHDSQELLAFLLDGLHEDLNRVRHKPYIEAKDGDGRPDEDFALECWKNHKARNDSIIVDTCQGQYKSTLVCPVCSKVSVTFDPFMYLSLPLPSYATRTMTVTVFHGDGSALPMPLLVTVPKYGCCKDLTHALSTTCRLESDKAILLAEVYDHAIYKYFDIPSESLSSIKDEERIVAYILPKNHEKLQRLEIMHKESSDNRSNFYRNLIGTPLVMCLDEEQHGSAAYQVAVEKLLKPLLRQKPLSSQIMKSDKENGCSPDLDDINLEERHPSPIDEDMEMEPSYGETEQHIPTFQLSLTDEKAMNSTPISNDTICDDFRVRIVLDWSDKENDLYDFSYLNNLPEVCKTDFSQKKTHQDTLSLFSCLDAFLKEEPLGPDDMWYCPRCKEHRQATKKLDLWKLPDILVIHLKRFSYSRYFKNKLDTFVNFPIHNLDLSKYLKHRSVSTQSYIYELYAVSNHYGGLGGGHYSAYAKLVDENSWYHFDDSHVSPVIEESIRTSAAYVLFYKRVDKAVPQINDSDSSPSSSCS